jgi:hypothetical protein
MTSSIGLLVERRVQSMAQTNAKRLYYEVAEKKTANSQEAQKALD